MSKMTDHFPELAESESKFVDQTITQLVTSVIAKYAQPETWSTCRTVLSLYQSVNCGTEIVRSLPSANACFQQRVKAILLKRFRRIFQPIALCLLRSTVSKLQRFNPYSRDRIYQKGAGFFIKSILKSLVILAM